MVFQIPKEDIFKLLSSQLSNFFFLTTDEEIELENSFDKAIELCSVNFSHSDNKYYSRISEEGGVKYTFFSPYHSVQWMTFLYYLSHTIYSKGSTTAICDKLYYLNKVLNGVEIFYAIELPEWFGAEHPIGSVLGRAKYGDGFFFYHGCTVGASYDKLGLPIHPVLGKNVRMFAGSSILGKCNIGDNVMLSAGTTIINQDVPNNMIVYGRSPDLTFKLRTHL